MKKNTPSKIKKPGTRQALYTTPFNKYFRLLNDIDKGKRYSGEYGSILILGLVEEIGEMARAYIK